MFHEGVKEGYFELDNFSLRECGYETLTRRVVDSMDPRQADSTLLTEAGEFEGIDTTAFSNITGQYVYSAIMQAYEQEAFVFSRLIPAIPTRLDGEKIPGIGQIGDKSEEVHPGMPYPHVGLAEDYVDTPSTTKRGLIVPVTKEAIFFDRTNLLQRRCSEVGEVVALGKEKRLCDMVAGITNNYKWKGTSYDTYSTDGTTGEAGGTGLVINKLTSNELVDWTDVDNAEQLVANILDPNTSEPIVINPTDVVVMPKYNHAAQRVFNATEIRYTDSGAATLTVAANPVVGQYTLHKTAQMYRRIIYNGGGTAVAAADAAKYWFIGDFRRAFAYMQNWPITVTQAPVNSEAEFNQDIILRFKASERGAAAVMNPRYVVKCTG